MPIRMPGRSWTFSRPASLTIEHPGDLGTALLSVPGDFSQWSQPSVGILVVVLAHRIIIGSAEGTRCSAVLPKNEVARRLSFIPSRSIDSIFHCAQQTVLLSSETGARLSILPREVQWLLLRVRAALRLVATGTKLGYDLTSTDKPQNSAFRLCLFIPSSTLTIIVQPALANRVRLFVFFIVLSNDSEKFMS